MCGNSLEFNKPVISGKTAVYALIGDPVDHTMSPAIQNAAFHSLGIDAVYAAFQVSPRRLKAGIGGLRALGVKGFNITLPHKMKVLRYLDEIESSASAIGSVNTVVNTEGKLRGYNTDGTGAVDALVNAGAAPKGKAVLMFGAGGAGRAIAYALAQQASSLNVINRSATKAKDLVTWLRRKFSIDVTYATVSSKLLPALVKKADIVVNASSMGMHGVTDPPVEAAWLRPNQWVFDIVYKPLQTRLLEIADKAGAKRVNGLDMLLNQGACSFELWNGKKAPIFEMRKAMTQNLSAVEHARSS